MEKTFNTVRTAFYSGQYAFTGDLEPIQKIAFLIDNKYLNLTISKITSKASYLNLLNKPDDILKADEASGGEITHVALKLLSRTYLQNSTTKSIVFEHPFYGFYPDVMTIDGQIIVECGHTDNAEKIFTYFQQGHTQRIILVPYPSEEDKEVLGYTLTANENLIPFLEEERKESDETILSILNRKR